MVVHGEDFMFMGDVAGQDFALACVEHVVRGKPEVQGVSVEVLDLKEDPKSFTSRGTKEEDKAGAKALGNDDKYMSVIATINCMATDVPAFKFA